MDLKRCFKCGEEKLRTEFYRHPQMGDGLLGKCKACTKLDKMANNAVRDGKLERPTLCEGCGLPNRLEKHHPDYSQPLLVVWLCKPCHAIADKIRRKTERVTA